MSRRDYGELTSYFFIEYYVYIRPCIAELRENKIYYKTVIVISFKKYQLEITERLVQLNCEAGITGDGGDICAWRQRVVTEEIF